MSPRLILLALAALAALALAGCTVKTAGDKRFLYPTFLEPDGVAVSGPPVIRQPVLPEMLVSCRGHVLVPALGMTFVPRNADAPATGQFLREESVSPPYRIIAPGARMSQDQNAARLNVELDRARRVVGLFCG